MTTPTLSVIALFGILAIGSVVSANDEKAASVIAAENHLTQEQTEAFQSCRNQMAGRGLVLRNELGHVQRYSVPDEICVCQSRNMAAALVPGHYDAHRLVIDYKSGATGVHMLTPFVLKSATGDGIFDFVDLANGLGACVDDYQRQQAAKTEWVKQKLLQQNAESRH